MTEQCPADIISPITDGVLPNKKTPAEARAAGYAGHEKPTPENSIAL